MDYSGTDYLKTSVRLLFCSLIPCFWHRQESHCIVSCCVWDRTLPPKMHAPHVHQMLGTTAITACKWMPQQWIAVSSIMPSSAKAFSDIKNELQSNMCRVLDYFHSVICYSLYAHLLHVSCGIKFFSPNSCS